MLATFFTKADNLGSAASIAGANTAMRVVGLSTAEISVWGTHLAEWANGDFKLLSTDQVESQYSPEMVDLLLRLKARGPVLKFKNSREALERLLPSRG